MPAFELSGVPALSYEWLVVALAASDAAAAVILHRAFQTLVLLLVELAVEPRTGHFVDVRTALAAERTRTELWSVKPHEVVLAMCTLTGAELA
jgi:hypothetical protein